MFYFGTCPTGTHANISGSTRQTWGHSLVISPWGKVLADVGQDVGVTMVDFDLSDVDAARGRVPSLTHDRAFESP